MDPEFVYRAVNDAVSKVSAVSKVFAEQGGSPLGRTRIIGASAELPFPEGKAALASAAGAGIYCGTVMVPHPSSLDAAPALDPRDTIRYTDIAAVHREREQAQLHTNDAAPARDPRDSAAWAEIAAIQREREQAELPRGDAAPARDPRDAAAWAEIAAMQREREQVRSSSPDAALARDAQDSAACAESGAMHQERVQSSSSDASPGKGQRDVVAQRERKLSLARAAAAGERTAAAWCPPSVMLPRASPDSGSLCFVGRALLAWRLWARNAKHLARMARCCAARADETEMLSERLVLMLAFRAWRPDDCGNKCKSSCAEASSTEEVVLRKLSTGPEGMPCRFPQLVHLLQRQGGASSELKSSFVTQLLQRQAGQSPKHHLRVIARDPDACDICDCDAASHGQRTDETGTDGWPNQADGKSVSDESSIGSLWTSPMGSLKLQSVCPSFELGVYAALDTVALGISAEAAALQESARADDGEDPQRGIQSARRALLEAERRAHKFVLATRRAGEAGLLGARQELAGRGARSDTEDVFVQRASVSSWGSSPLRSCRSLGSERGSARRFRASSSSSTGLGIEEEREPERYRQVLAELSEARAELSTQEARAAAAVAEHARTQACLKVELEAKEEALHAMHLLLADERESAAAVGRCTAELRSQLAMQAAALPFSEGGGPISFSKLGHRRASMAIGKTSAVFGATLSSSASSLHAPSAATFRGCGVRPDSSRTVSPSLSRNASRPSSLRPSPPAHGASSSATIRSPPGVTPVCGASGMPRRSSGASSATLLRSTVHSPPSPPASRSRRASLRYVGGQAAQQHAYPRSNSNSPLQARPSREVAQGHVLIHVPTWSASFTPSSRTRVERTPPSGTRLLTSHTPPTSASPPRFVAYQHSSASSYVSPPRSVQLRSQTPVQASRTPSPTYSATPPSHSRGMRTPSPPLWLGATTPSPPLRQGGPARPHVSGGQRPAAQSSAVQRPVEQWAFVGQSAARLSTSIQSGPILQQRGSSVFVAFVTPQCT